MVGGSQGKKRGGVIPVQTVIIIILVIVIVALLGRDFLLPAKGQDDQADSVNGSEQNLSRADIFDRFLNGYQQSRASSLYYALESRPDDPEVHKELGSVYYAASVKYSHPELMERTVETFRRATELAPQDTEARAMLGWSVLNLGRFDEAAQHFNAARSIEQDALASLGAGWTAYADGRLDEARDRFNEVLTLEDGSASSLVRDAEAGLGWTEYRAGNPQTALTHLPSLSKDARILPQLGKVVSLQAAGRTQEASDLMERLDLSSLQEANGETSELMDVTGPAGVLNRAILTCIGEAPGPERAVYCVSSHPEFGMILHS